MTTPHAGCSRCGCGACGCGCHRPCLPPPPPPPPTDRVPLLEDEHGPPTERLPAIETDPLSGLPLWPDEPITEVQCPDPPGRR